MGNEILNEIQNCKETSKREKEHVKPRVIKEQKGLVARERKSVVKVLQRIQ
jgi:hypothetical protein